MVNTLSVCVVARRNSSSRASPPRSVSYPALLSKPKNKSIFSIGPISDFAAAATETENHCTIIRAAQAESRVGDEGKKLLGKKSVDIVWKFG